MSVPRPLVENRLSSGVDHPTRYRIAADHHERELAEVFGDTYLDSIINSIVNQPRSLQKRIGPSEMGIECERAILHKLNGDQEPNRGDVPWKATIGTAVHTYMDDEVFTPASKPGMEQQGRWLVEQRVTVGEVNGIPITGSTDLFDTWGGIVADHKFVGKSTLQKYRAHGPSPTYRAQAHLYGRGWVNRGYKVRMVAICFLPREGDLPDAFIWTEPYQEQIALDAIARVDRLARLLAIVGIDQALAPYGECSDRWCRWCGSGNSFGRRPMAPSTAALIGGAPPPATTTAGLLAQ